MSGMKIFFAILLSLMVTSAAQAQTLQTVRVASVPLDVAGNVYYAQDLGYFAKAGLDVQITTLVTGGSAAAAVAGGAVDIGTSNLVSIAQAHERGIPLVIIAPSGTNSSGSPLEGIIVAKNGPIKTAKDLEGKTIATTGLLNNMQVEAAAWIEKNGGDYKTLKWVEVPGVQMGAAVATGRIDAATPTEPYVSAALAAGDVRLLGYVVDAISPSVIEGGYFCTAEYARAHPDVVKKFARALLDAGQWANHNHDAAMAILEKYSKATPAASAHHAIFPETFKPSDLQPLLDAATRYGALKAPVSASDLVVAQ
jgi:NitT/TauT family transport system substrate-binding protein